MGSRRAGGRWHAKKDSKYRDKPSDHFGGASEGYGAKKNGGKHPPERRPLPNDLDILSVVIGRVKFSNEPESAKSKTRPFYIWGKYYDESGTLQAVDCFTSSTQNDKNGYFGKLYMDENMNHRAGGERRKASIKPLDSYYFLNNKKIFANWITAALPKDLIPDLILRRVMQLLYNPEPRGPNAGLFIKNKGWVRHGIVFNELSSKDILDKRRFAPEASDAPFQQVPYEIEGVLEQADIDNIYRIAVNYHNYCLNISPKPLPVILPELGTWGHWPEEFMAFVEPQKYPANLPWLNSEVLCCSETGFPVDMSKKTAFTPNPGSNHYLPQNHPASP